MYQPLPSCVTIKKSDIHGLGLWCVEKIIAGQEIGLSHFYWGETLMRTPLGAFYNHDPVNANIEKIAQDSRFMMVATKDIWPGQEILCNYTLYDPSA
jgi:SET domain-containing protein